MFFCRFSSSWSLFIGYDFFSFMEIAGNLFSDRIPGFVVTPFSGFLA